MTTNDKKSVSLTPFGIFARKLRTDHGEYQHDMAERLGVTTSYLSAVERGHRNVPNNWVDRLGDMYGITAEDLYTFRKAASESRTYDSLDISHLNFEDKRLIGEIAIALPDASDEIREAVSACVSQKSTKPQ